jgi:hypothetical protein
MGFWKKLTFCIALVLASTSCSNVLDGVSSSEQSTDAAILYSARMHLGSGDYDGAIAEFVKLSAATLAETDVTIDYASAYSGKCGLDFLDLADDINNIGSEHLMTMLMKAISASSAAKYGYCKQAETLLKTIANASGVVSTEKGQFLMAFNSLAKIGAILNFEADADKDGNVDAGWDPCDPTDGDTYLPVSEVNEIGTGIVLFYQNLKNASYAASLTSAIGTLCTAINGQPYDFCAVIDPTAIDANERSLIRGIVVETDDGVGLSISPGDTVANVCGSS